MNKMDRFHAAINGDRIDRVPVCVWMHFITPYMNGQQSAERHCDFFKHYDWDIAKAVSDYRYPFPGTMESIKSVADMGRITVQSMDHPTYAEQLNLLKGMRQELGNEWPIIDTTFDPFQQVLRHSGYSGLPLVLDNPAAARPMLEAATETVIRYIRELKRIGVDGIFYSTRGASTPDCAQGFERAAFEDLLKPFDHAILEEAKGMTRMLHCCLTHLDLNRVTDYPREVTSWADRDPTCPNLGDIRKLTDKCLMGGINQDRVMEQSRAEIRQDINEAVNVNHGRSFILSPGCTIGSHVPGYALDTIADYMR